MHLSSICEQVNSCQVALSNYYGKYMIYLELLYQNKKVAIPYDCNTTVILWVLKAFQNSRKAPSSYWQIVHIQNFQQNLQHLLRKS